MPEERSKKDKTRRVAIKGLVVGGQPVGIAHAKLLGRPPNFLKSVLKPQMLARGQKAPVGPLASA